ncbi:MAG: ABC transporter ATP-binding protein [Candidatus Bathyarchaeales archaeon]
MQKQLLTVENLTVEYWARRGKVRAVDNVSFSLGKTETLGVVGESGSGKSTLGLSLIRLVPPPGRIVNGHVWLEGIDLLKLREDEMRKVRGRKISFIFQDPMTSLNPVKKIGEHFVELIRTHEPKTSDEEAIQRAEKLLEDVGIQPERINDYPHQLSGGMRQRVMIALAIVLNPCIVVADEPTTALDVIVQAKILDLLKDVQNKYAMTLILITHDLSIAMERCDKILVMYAGHMVEHAYIKDIYQNPQHPYTQGLLRSIPNIELAEQKLEAIPGSPPDLLNLPKGCRFWPRCSSAMEICRKTEPKLIETEPGHFVRCFLYGDAKK